VLVVAVIQVGGVEIKNHIVWAQLLHKTIFKDPRANTIMVPSPEFLSWRIVASP
jgi:hypothetical protein